MRALSRSADPQPIGGRQIVNGENTFREIEQGEFAELHAGRGETSLIMHLRPELVKMDQVKPDFAPSQGREFFDYTGLAAVSPTGLWGAPSKASPEQGEQLLRNATQRAVDYIKRTFAEIDRLEKARGEGSAGCPPAAARPRRAPCTYLALTTCPGRGIMIQVHTYTSSSGTGAIQMGCCGSKKEKKETEKKQTCETEKKQTKKSCSK